jgi:hypothetical protein
VLPERIISACASQKSTCTLNFKNRGWSTPVGVSHVVVVGLNAWL